MPCNSDYMMPTQEEIKRVRGKAAELKAVADEMVYSADVMREAILKSEGQLTKLFIREGVELGKRIGDADSLVQIGDALVKQMKGEYAYLNMGHKDFDTMISVYEKAKAKFLQARSGAEDLINEIPIAPSYYEALEQDQIEHRMEDVKRLIKVFTNKGDFKTVAKLAQVDFLKPLDDQIGFSPDDV